VGAARATLASVSLSSSPAVRACRDLAAVARFATLATVAREPAGWPFATLVAVAFDAEGRPLLLLSKLAEHTKNVEACSRASLLVSAAHGAQAAEAVDPPAEGRMTLVGEFSRVRVPGAEATGAENALTAARARFLAVHPEAAGYASFADFGFWCMNVAHVRWVGGFGRMEWVTGEEYLAVPRRPSPG
jgi:heme iron utilization protein